MGIYKKLTTTHITKYEQFSFIDNSLSTIVPTMKLILFVFFSLACAMPDGLDKQSGQVEQSPRGANEWICSTPTFQLLVGDGRCDDFVNVEHEGCEWDGGDC